MKKSQIEAWVTDENPPVRSQKTNEREKVKSQWKRECKTNERRQENRNDKMKKANAVNIELIWINDQQLKIKKMWKRKLNYWKLNYKIEHVK